MGNPLSLAMMLMFLAALRSSAPDYMHTETKFNQYGSILKWRHDWTNSTGKKCCQSISVWKTWNNQELNNICATKYFPFLMAIAKHKNMTTFTSINSSQYKIDPSQCSKYFYLTARITALSMNQVGKLGRGHIAPTEFDAKLLKGPKT